MNYLELANTKGLHVYVYWWFCATVSANMFIWKIKWKVHNSWILLHLPFTLFGFFSSNASRSLSYLNKNMYIRKVWQSKQFRTESNGSLLILCISNLVIEDQTIKYHNTAYYFFDTTLILKQKPCQLVMVPDCISFKIYFLLWINLDGVFFGDMLNYIT